jgi:hypothetical protein
MLETPSHRPTRVRSKPLIRRANLSFLLVLIVTSAHAQCPPPSPPGGTTIDNVHNGNFGYSHRKVGPYWSYLNVWDPPTNGSAYSTTITNCPSTYPNGTVISWSPDYLKVMFMAIRTWFLAYWEEDILLLQRIYRHLFSWEALSLCVRGHKML